MKTRSLYYPLSFLAFVVAIGMACSALTGSPTQPPAPTAVQVFPTETPAPPTATPVTGPTDANVGANPSGSGLITFTDKNNFYQIDVPADWVHTTASGDYYYSDTFTSPDKGAVIENIAYDDGTPFTGSTNGRFALQILNQNYSKTGKEGDIKITEEKQQPDGSDRLTWTSKGGGYSGISFFEIRNQTTFLMFTVDWGNDYESQYLDTLNKVIESYRVP